MRCGVAILGSTGSIGAQALEVIEANSDRFEVISLAAGANTDLLASQAQKHAPKFISVQHEHSVHEVKRAVGGVEVAFGQEGLVQAALHPEASIVVNAVVGAVGVAPTIAALKAGKRVALANKEALIAAGPLVKQALAAGGGELIPVDSEHSAIFQCLQGEDRAALRKIILTASGGPFLHASTADMARVSVADALKHPTWQMGGKITIDSATLMNKGLEVIEAHWLFDVDFDRIDVVVHPQSVVHSMAQFVDGSIVAQLGAPDMRLPIQYALEYPNRNAASWRELQWDQALELTFQPPDFDRFPSLRLAYQAGRAGGTMPAVLNAANEVAVQAFLDGRIGFLDIARCVETVMEAHRPTIITALEDVLTWDGWARSEATRFVAERGRPIIAK